jgi:hypothetical protein
MLQFRGMGIHITEFSTLEDAHNDEAAITSMYQSNRNLFCKSQPRVWMYKQLVPDDYIPYSKGGLQVNPKGTDANPSQVLDSSYWATITPPPLTPVDPTPLVEDTK